MSPRRRVADMLKSPRSGSLASHASTRAARASATRRALASSSSAAATANATPAEVLGLVRPLGVAAAGSAKPRPQRRVDRRGYDENRKSGCGDRFGFTRGDAPAADDQDSAAVRTQSNWKHSGSPQDFRTRLPKTAVSGHQHGTPRPGGILSVAQSPRSSPCRGLIRARFGTTAKPRTGKSLAKFCSATTG